MNIIEAMKVAQNGGKVRIKEWDKSVYLVAPKGDPNWKHWPIPTVVYSKEQHMEIYQPQFSDFTDEWEEVT